MSKFEEHLIKKGYLMFTFDCKTLKFIKAKGYILSSMVNLDHRYIHKDDTNLLSKIEKGMACGENGITFEDRKNVIVFGLHEKDKPPILIRPRPKIRVKRLKKIKFTDSDLYYERPIIENEDFDDNMNLVFQKESIETIFDSLFDDTVVFEYDLTDNHQQSTNNQ